ncbi:hypothetical protein EV188_102921 [Actinomycetospora succinea]|uniref:Uncharacterized protein n=1 Tax=Actinomycetospora succinea TaxID=663603 RepID=A0A4R6VJD4_9PSEU|nr:hypothetical protein [Actinomycetospora succinea]TDQ63264.1 hypothetical protein EV188_102921 [Actinomycetospora succinea]
MIERDAVPCGPFQTEPFDLGRVLSVGSSGDEVVRRSERWLVGVLDDADVELGAADREIAALLAADGWSVAQVVGGWVRRAGREPAPVARELVAPGVTRVG